jgi:hypothetical protein
MPVIDATLEIVDDCFSEDVSVQTIGIKKDAGGLEHDSIQVDRRQW